METILAELRKGRPDQERNVGKGTTQRHFDKDVVLSPF